MIAEKECELTEISFEATMLSIIALLTTRNAHRYMHIHQILEHDELIVQITK